MRALRGLLSFGSQQVRQASSPSRRTLGVQILHVLSSAELLHLPYRPSRPRGPQPDRARQAMRLFLAVGCCFRGYSATLSRIMMSNISERLSSFTSRLYLHPTVTHPSESSDRNLAFDWSDWYVQMSHTDLTLRRHHMIATSEDSRSH